MSFHSSISGGPSRGSCVHAVYVYKECYGKVAVVKPLSLKVQLSVGGVIFFKSTENKMILQHQEQQNKF